MKKFKHRVHDFPQTRHLVCAELENVEGTVGTKTRVGILAPTSISCVTFCKLLKLPAFHLPHWKNQIHYICVIDLLRKLGGPRTFKIPEIEGLIIWTNPPAEIY